MKRTARALFLFLFYLILPAAAFFAGVRWIDSVFRADAVPAPSTPVGVAVGAAFACWTLAAAVFLKKFIRR